MKRVIAAAAAIILAAVLAGKVSATGLHYRVEQQDPDTATTGLAALYPHDPANASLSVQDYLEAMLASGWKLNSFSGSARGSGLYIFKAKHDDE